MKRIEIIKQAQNKINLEKSGKKLLTVDELNTILNQEYSTPVNNTDSVKTLNFN